MYTNGKVSDALCIYCKKTKPCVFLKEGGTYFSGGRNHGYEEDVGWYCQECLKLLNDLGANIKR